MVGVLLGAFFLLFMLACVLAARHMNDLQREVQVQDAIIEDMQRVAVVRQRQLNTFKNRLFKELIKKAELDEARIMGLVDTEVDLVNSLAALQGIVQRNEGYMIELAHGHNNLGEITGVTVSCQARFGHKFECVNILMGSDEPVYEFKCSVCGLTNAVEDSLLTAKEKKMAQKYIDSFQKPKKSIKKKRGQKNG